MLREYPIKKPISAHGTGRLFYEFLMKNLTIPASANHNIWYLGAQAQLEKPDLYTFRGDIPKGQTLDLIALAGKPIQTPYTFSGNESYVLVSDLSDEAKASLRINPSARGKDKVFNGNFKPYEDLPDLTKISNELAGLSVAKSISSYLAGNNAKVNYSERDVLQLLTAAFDDLAGKLSLKKQEILFMGDDIPDLVLYDKVGISACPADAAPENLQKAMYISPNKGGHGCVREVIERVMRLQGKWNF